jgi:hypothetical protein
MEVEEPKMNFFKRHILKTSQTVTNKIVDDSKKIIVKNVLFALNEAIDSGIIKSVFDAKQNKGTGLNIWLYASADNSYIYFEITPAGGGDVFKYKTDLEGYQKFVNEVLK